MQIVLCTCPPPPGVRTDGTISPLRTHDHDASYDCCVPSSTTAITFMEIASLLGLLLWHAIFVLAEDVRRPFELTVLRNPDTHRCTHAALRETQLFRALPDEGYTSSRLLETSEEWLRFTARDEERVWARAEALCGDRSAWDFHTLMHGTASPSLQFSSDVDQGQVVLNTHQAQEEPLPLEIEPLITSGDSDNRVDLVFFADGCKCSSLQSLGSRLRRMRSYRYFGGEGQVRPGCAPARGGHLGQPDVLHRQTAAEFLGCLHAQQGGTSPVDYMTDMFF